MGKDGQRAVHRIQTIAELSRFFEDAENAGPLRIPRQLLEEMCHAVFVHFVQQSEESLAILGT
jgi:hypothetical protein